jgi:hypothetical protein
VKIIYALVFFAGLQLVVGFDVAGWLRS